MFDFIEKNPNKITRDFLALITDTMKTTPTLNSSGFPFRGLIIEGKYWKWNKKFIRNL